MASLIPNQETPGRVLRRVEFDPVSGGRRQRIRLGKITAREGDDFKRRIEELVGDLRLGQQHTASLSDWLNKLPPAAQIRLQKAGLIKIARQSGQSLDEFLDRFKGRAAVKDSTSVTYSNTIWNLIAHFGRDHPIQTITTADAFAFKDYLHTPNASRQAKPLSRATISRRIIMARQFFTAARRMELVAKIPSKK